MRAVRRSPRTFNPLSDRKSADGMVRHSRSPQQIARLIACELTEPSRSPSVSVPKRMQFAPLRRFVVKSILLAAITGFAVLSATAPAPAEARSTERSIKNRLDPDRITDKRVHRRDYNDRRAHRRDYGARRYSWRDGDDYRYRRYDGWSRYSNRPYGWRDRGCASIGPVWFCS